jgi:hypothetical protein
VDPVRIPKAVEQCLVEELPHSGLVPFLEATPAGHSGTAAHLLGQHLPRDAALEDEQYASDSGAVVDTGPAALGLGRLFGQQWLDHFPQFVCNEFFSHTPTLPTTKFC